MKTDMWQYSNTPERGFTLLEVIVTITVLGIMCAMAALTFGGASTHIFESRNFLSDAQTAQGVMEDIKVQFEILLKQNTESGAAAQALRKALAEKNNIFTKTVTIDAGGTFLSCLLVTVSNGKASLSHIFAD